MMGKLEHKLILVKVGGAGNDRAELMLSVFEGGTAEGIGGRRDGENSVVATEGQGLDVGTVGGGRQTTRTNPA